MRVDLKCAQCGGNSFALDGTKADSSLIECDDCGHRIGTLAELKERVAAEVINNSKRSSF